MRHAEFRHWLQTVYETRDGGRLDEQTCNSRMANCGNVERHEGDLDDHFQRDRLRDLIARLRYSTDDQRHGRKPKHCVPINGNQRTGSSTLKQAVSLYQQFCKYMQSSGSLPLRSKHAASVDRLARKRRLPAADWPEWTLPDNDAILALARTVAPFIRWLHPDVVAAIAEDNERRRASWSSQLHEYGIDPEAFLWELSPCAFPGVRRYAGSKEIAQYRGHTGDKNFMPTDALCLDDNDFPKHVWSFILRGRPFQKFGPAGYALAHLADHKEHNNRCLDEFIMPDGSGPPICFFGLYTSPANTVYVPTNFIKPTDFNGTLRTMLQRKAADMYGKVCNLVPPPLRVKAAPSGKWDIGRFSWGQPVGTTANLKDFLKYRAETIDGLLAEGRS
jgi:hypothetical protein